MSDNKVRFHVVHSVKGGCGKTSFSLKKSIELAEVRDKSGKVDVDADSGARVLYLDCDFRGSALKVLLYGISNAIPVGVYDSNEAGYIGTQPIEKSRFIDFDTKYDDCRTLGDFITQVQQVDLDDIIVHGFTYIDRDTPSTNIVPGHTPHVYIDKYTITGKIDFIFSPSDLDMKRCFGHTALHSGKDAMLNIGLFRLRMRKLLGRILNYGELDKDHPAVYTDVVLDMPPGSDEYSDALLREIRELAAGDKVEVIYYNITTMDRGHMYATADYIADLWKVSDEKQQICCVFSEMTANEFGGNFENLAVNFSVMMDNNESFSEYPKDGLNYYASHFSQEYYDTTHSGKEAIKLESNITELLYSKIHIEVK